MVNDSHKEAPKQNNCAAVLCFVLLCGYLRGAERVLYSVRDAEQNLIGRRNSSQTRFARFVALDVEFAKEFQITKRYGVRLSVSGFNLTNHFNPRDVRANVADLHFGEFFNSYRRYFSGGFEIVF